ncbi:hypothetical protein FB446DRAFT_728461 [Lentinula raphanica]|nr:hypothetical protein FB446DRAFT_728461 [Lentinula raphanica]
MVNHVMVEPCLTFTDPSKKQVPPSRIDTQSPKFNFGRGSLRIIVFELYRTQPSAMYIRLLNLLVASSVTLSGFILSTIAGPIRFPTSDTSASVAGSAHIITQPSHELYHLEPIPDADTALDLGRTENQSGHDILAATSLHGIALPPDTGSSEGLNPTDTETIQEEPADANSITAEPEHVETPNPPDARVEHPSPISVEQPSHTVANDHVLDFNVESFPGFTPHHIQLVDIQTPIATCEPSTQLQDSTATAFHPRNQEKTQNVDISNESPSAAVAGGSQISLYDPFHALAVRFHPAQ